MATTYTREQVEAAIRDAVAEFGPNQAAGDLSYRREGHAPGSGALIAFTFVPIAGRDDAYEQIGYA